MEYYRKGFKNTPISCWHDHLFQLRETKGITGIAISFYQPSGNQSNADYGECICTGFYYTVCTEKNYTDGFFNRVFFMDGADD
jgi:hypothetical protein